MWLKANNQLYNKIEIDDGNLQLLPEEDVLPYHVEHIMPDAAQDTLVSRYDNVPEPDEPSVERTHFESMVIADVDGHTPASQLSAAAVRHTIIRGKPFIQISHGAKPVNKFFNVNLSPMLYPHYFNMVAVGLKIVNTAKQSH